MSAIDKLVKDLADELGSRAALQVSTMVLDYYKGMLLDAHDALACISSQWHDKGLPADFFCLPEDLEGLITRLGKAIGK